MAGVGAWGEYVGGEGIRPLFSRLTLGGDIDRATRFAARIQGSEETKKRF